MLYQINLLEEQNLYQIILKEIRLKQERKSFRKDKLMGMIQLKRKNDEVYKVGCLGKISDFQKSRDGRILINLIGLSRFEVIEEAKNSKLYREFRVNYEKFNLDFKAENEGIETETIVEKAKIFFKKSGLLLNWKEFEKLDEMQKIDTLSMISPITNEEKQKLLEAFSINDKIKTLEDIISFYLHDVNFNNKNIQ